MESCGGDIREVNIKQTKKSFLVLPETEVDTDALLNLDQDEGAAINRRARSKRTAFAESSSGGSKRTRISHGLITKSIAQQRLSYFPDEARTASCGR